MSRIGKQRGSVSETNGSGVFLIALFEDLSDNPLRMTARRFAQRHTLAAHPPPFHIHHSTLNILPPLTPYP